MPTSTVNKIVFEVKPIEDDFWEYCCLVNPNTTGSKPQAYNMNSTASIPPKPATICTPERPMIPALHWPSNFAVNFQNAGANQPGRQYNYYKIEFVIPLTSPEWVFSVPPLDNVRPLGHITGLHLGGGGKTLRLTIKIPQAPSSATDITDYTLRFNLQAFNNVTNKCHTSHDPSIGVIRGGG